MILTCIPQKELDPAEKITTEIPDSTAAVQIRSQSMHVSALNVECPDNSSAGCESSEGKVSVKPPVIWR